MSEARKLQEETMLPIKAAAEHVSYSRDYVARIAREGKVVAEQRGRQWFVSLSSLEQFVVAAAQEREVRRHVLSEQRRREREEQEQVAALAAASARRRARAPRVAGAAVALVLTLGLGAASLLLQLPIAGELAHWTVSPAATPLAREQVLVESSQTSTREAERVVPAVRTKVSLTPHFATERTQQALAAQGDLLVLGRADVGAVATATISSYFSHAVVLERDERGEWRVYRASPSGEPIGRGIPFVAIPGLAPPPTD